MVDAIRALIADTNPLRPIFQDEEIMIFYRIQAATFQSSMYFSGIQGSVNLPQSPISYLRVAALALDAMASNKAYLASIKSIPDVTLNTANASSELMKKAAGYRQVDDESGAFVIIEQVCTTWAFTQRYWSQVQRQTGGGYYP